MIDKIKIGGIVYDVVDVKNLQGSEREPIDGQVRFTDACIDIDDRLKDQVRMRVLFHEAIHCILETSRRCANTPDETVDSLAYGFLQLLRDNPQIIDEIREL